MALKAEDQNQFILDNQEAFYYGAMEEFGQRSKRFEEEGEIISKETIQKAIGDGEAYRIIKDDQAVGGAVVKVKGERGYLELFFVSPREHSKGIGYFAWCELERMYPGVKIWETVTPYFEKRNIHFYVNRCGFHIVEFYNKYQPDPNTAEINTQGCESESAEEEMFRFEKVIGNQ